MLTGANEPVDISAVVENEEREMTAKFTDVKEPMHERDRDGGSGRMAAFLPAPLQTGTGRGGRTYDYGPRWDDCGIKGCHPGVGGVYPLAPRRWHTPFITAEGPSILVAIAIVTRVDCPAPVVVSYACESYIMMVQSLWAVWRYAGLLPFYIF